MKQWVTITVAITIVLVVGLFAFRDPDTKKSVYANMTEARAEGAVQRGWIPDWLPDDIRNIQEVHNLDRSDGMISFDWDGPLGDLGPDCIPRNLSESYADCPGFQVQRYMGRVTMTRIVEP